MVKNKTLWETTYEEYKKVVSTNNYKKNKPSKVKSRNLDKEPMVLLEEYREIQNQIKQLTKRKNHLRRKLTSMGTDPVKHYRSPYYEKPIMLYVLKLKYSCWYIGMSRNVEKRFKAHQKGKTLWTKENPPIEIYEVRDTKLSSDSDAGKLEDELTLEYAKTYGIDKVRGGGYCQRKPKWPKELLEPDLSWITMQ